MGSDAAARALLHDHAGDVLVAFGAFAFALLILFGHWFGWWK